MNQNQNGNTWMQGAYSLGTLTTEKKYADIPVEDRRKTELLEDYKSGYISRAQLKEELDLLK